MVKNRRGLQEDIAGIFRGVPVPEKKLQTNLGGITPLPKFGDTALSKPQIKGQGIPEIKTFQSIEVIPAKTSQSTSFKHAPSKYGSSKHRSSFRKQKILLVTVVLLSVVLVFLLARNFHMPLENPSNLRLVAVGQAKTTISPNVHIDWPVPPVYPENIRDPMELIKVKMPDIPTGVIVSIDNKFFAVIEGQLLSEEDIVRGMTVVKVSSNDVEFRANEETLKQKMPRLVVKGIVHSDEIPLAVIGINTVKEGDAVMGVTVVKINQNSVEFEIAGVKWVQKVEGNE